MGEAGGFFRRVFLTLQTLSYWPHECSLRRLGSELHPGHGNDGVGRRERKLPGGDKFCGLVLPTAGTAVGYRAKNPKAGTPPPQPISVSSISLPLPHSPSSSSSEQVEPFLCLCPLERQPRTLLSPGRCRHGCLTLLTWKRLYVSWGLAAVCRGHGPLTRLALPSSWPDTTLGVLQEVPG